MCLVFFSLKNHPTYKLIVAANRDEFYTRRTSAAGFWEDCPDVLGGRDQEAQGTWMAMNKSGRISFVTNYRDPKNAKPNAPSRGKLVSDYLINPILPEEYLKKVKSAAGRYNGFNLVVGTPDELWYFSNYREGIEKITPGFYGLSNQLLETPWPKVLKGKEKLGQVLRRDKVSHEEVFTALYDDRPAPDEKLPDTGVGLERERALSSMFIKTPNYGSRSSTFILVDNQNNVLFSERVYDFRTFEFTTNLFEFRLSDYETSPRFGNRSVNSKDGPGQFSGKR